MTDRSYAGAVGRCLLAVLCLAAAWPASATETENFDLQVLPAPGQVTIDAAFGDWDLSGGIFACGDAENARDKYAVWLHAMYDRDAIYVLARWIDLYPLNHPGSVKGDYGFNGDCLQVRFVTALDVTRLPILGHQAKDAEAMRTSHWDCWRDRDGLDALNGCYGHSFNEGGPGDAKAQGAAQAFRKNDDGKGYVQELRIPIKLLCKEGVTLQPGSQLLMTFEPNFTIGTGGRLTIKDGFRPGVPIDRVFTFSGSGCWGVATLEPKGRLTPRPVRLSDGREFAVHLENGVPVVDWTGIVKSREPEGFKPLTFTLPEDGYVSLNVFRADGTVARQLLACAFYTKGPHEVKWDGLTTMSVRQPGQPLPAGEYTWNGFYHTGIGVKLRGVACTAGNGLGNWGGDHGDPVACATDGERIFLGWDGAEGGKALVAVDPNGNVRWRQLRGGIGSASLVATDGGTVYVLNVIGQYMPVAIYRVTAERGAYNEWESVKSTDLLIAQLWEELGGEKGKPQNPGALAAADGKVYAAFGGLGLVAVLDGKTGKVAKSLKVAKPGALAARGGKLYAVVGTEQGQEIQAIDVATGAAQKVASRTNDGQSWWASLTCDADGNLYAGIRGGDLNVQVFAPDGKLVRTIGRKGGRPLLGPWQPDGMLNPSGLAIDRTGQLWVTENDGAPRRISVWDAKTGVFKAEYFGGSTYGAIGACIDPIDPYRMVGQGCEWRIDPQTGRARCLGVVTRDGMGASRYGFSPDGKRLYLAVTPGFLHGTHPVRIFERLGDGQFKLRTVVSLTEKDKQKQVVVWADRNDDGAEQADEVKTYAKDLGGWVQGWYMAMTPDLSFYGSLHQLKVTGWTPCGAPEYDVAQAKRLPGPENAGGRGGMGAQHNHGSADGRYVLYNGTYGEDYSTVDCYDLATGQLRWTYPSNFTGVHGSHRACAPEVGMIRGAYDIVGAAKLPPPLGNVWVIPTNKGEWHILTENGFYLSKLFEGDPMKNQWPERAVPGAIMDACPPGAGEEAFGGSLTLTVDGKLQVQAGHTGFWNLEVTGLESVRALPQQGKLVLTAADVRQAQQFRDKYIQDAAGVKRLTIKKATPTFTGDLAKDFAGQAPVAYQRIDAARVQTALAWDQQNLYVAWVVKDDTPWQNGADAPEFMYAHGDTVDLQLGTNPKADRKRAEAVLGDLRLAIGPFQGRPTAVLYRPVAAEKAPKSFSSGVIKNYVVESVVVLKDVRVEVKVDPVKREYTVEAALPLAALGVPPTTGLVLTGDVGATHGNKDGNDTVLRTYWSNQSTGLVSDEVFELKLAPANWGELQFAE